MAAVSLGLERGRGGGGGKGNSAAFVARRTHPITEVSGRCDLDLQICRIASKRYAVVDAVVASLVGQLGECDPVRSPFAFVAESVV